VTAILPLRILGKASSINVRKVLWTCSELGLAYDREDWGSGFASTQTPAFLSMNPNGLVPVVQNGTDFLWESNTICRCLAAQAGRTDLLPSSPLARAGVEQWMDWQATDLNAAWRYAFMALVREDSAYADTAHIQASIRAWNDKIGILDQALCRSGAFAAGPAFTLADVVLGLSVNRWFMTPMERPEYPAVAAYYARLSTRPGFQQHGRNGVP
jgi:glutathione S-transferase